MNKRSKILLVILVSLILLTAISMLGSKEENVDKDLENFEKEIINPENELDPLNENFNNNVLLIEIALKTEDIIDKVFSVFVNLLKNITEKII
jgi:predicted RND superfamily exporter protein